MPILSQFMNAQDYLRVCPSLPSAAAPVKAAHAKLAGSQRAPYMDVRSEMGVLGLALLTARLKQAEGEVEQAPAFLLVEQALLSCSRPYGQQGAS